MRHIIPVLLLCLPTCTSSGPASGEGGFKITPTSIEADAKWSYGGQDPDRSFTLSNESKTPLCGEITFADAEGNPIGSPTTSEIPPGGSLTIPVPEGAVSHKITKKDCEEESAGLDGAGGRVRRAAMTSYTFMGAPLVPDPQGPNQTYCITITAFREEDAEDLLDWILAHGLARALPPALIEVHHYSEARMDPSGMLLTVADDDFFETLDIGLNGDPFYASLEDGTSVATASGWDAVIFRIPLSDLNYDPVPGASWRNDFDIRYSVQGAQGESQHYGYLDYVSE